MGHPVGTVLSVYFTVKAKECICVNHSLIKTTDRTLDAVFSRFGFNSFTITQRSFTQSPLFYVILCRLRKTPLGFCLMIIVNEFHPNLEKTTSSVLSVILINLWCKLSRYKIIFLGTQLRLNLIFLYTSRPTQLRIFKPTI